MPDDIDTVAGQQRPRIVDPDTVPITFIDYFMHCGGFGGVVNLAMGTIDHSRKEPDEKFAHIVVASRLRMTTGVAKELVAILQNCIADAERPINQGAGDDKVTGLVN